MYMYLYTSAAREISIYTERQKKHHFFRATLTEIHCIKTNYLNTDKLYIVLLIYTLKTPGSNLTRKGSIGAKLHSGSRI